MEQLGLRFTRRPKMSFNICEYLFLIYLQLQQKCLDFRTLTGMHFWGKGTHFSTMFNPIMLFMHWLRKASSKFYAPQKIQKPPSRSNYYQHSLNSLTLFDMNIISTHHMVRMCLLSTCGPCDTKAICLDKRQLAYQSFLKRKSQHISISGIFSKEQNRLEMPNRHKGRSRVKTNQIQRQL